jgi:hypothetical protein
MNMLSNFQRVFEAFGLPISPIAVAIPFHAGTPNQVKENNRASKTSISQWVFHVLAVVWASVLRTDFEIVLDV